MRPTALGGKAALFLALVTAAFLASPYTNLFFLLLSFLVVVLACGTLWSWLALRGVSARLHEVRPFPADREAVVVVEIATGRKPCFGAEVVLRLEDAPRRGVVLARAPVLAARGMHRIEGVLPPLPRGIHAITAAWLRTRHPFGLWWRRVPIGAPVDLVAHPAPLDGTGRARRAEDAEVRDLAAVGVRAPDAPAGLREWQAGDALHAVDWRATARRAKPIVKELDRESGRALAVTLDRRCDPVTLERCLRFVASLSRRARELDEPLVLHTQGLSASFGTGQHTFDDLLRWLAAAETLPQSAEPPPPSSPDDVRLPGSLPDGGAG